MSRQPKPVQSFFRGSSRFGPLGGGLLGAAYFFWIFDARTVLPTNIDWLMSGDRAQQFLGWLFFLHTDWTFPVGRIDACIAPIGSYLAFCDPVPWLAVLFKLLAPLIDGAYQYSGLWLLGCFFFQGWFGALLARRLTAGLFVQLSAAALFVLSPMLLGRGDHIALNGQFLVLAAIHLYLSAGDLAGKSRRPGSVGRHTLRWTLLCALVTGVNPYLAVMVAPICLAAYLRIGLSGALTRWPRVLIHALFPVAAGLLVLFLFGFFSASTVSEAGFGFYSANLDTLINPRGRSRFFRGWPVNRGQYEGAAYLGAGVCFLLAAGVAGSVRRLQAVSWKRIGGQLPLLLAIGGLSVYALATPVCWHRTELLRLDWLYRHLEFITSTFRVSGRFVWPLAYCATLGALTLAVGRLGPRTRAVVLALAVALQFAELSPLHRGPNRRAGPIEWNTLKDDVWQTLGQRYDSLVLVPPQILGRRTWPLAYRHDHYVPFAFLAATHGMTCNSGFVARVPRDAVTRSCQSLLDQLQAGVVNPRAVHVVDELYLGAFRWWTRDRLFHRQVDGYHLFTSSPLGGEDQRCGTLEPLLLTVGFTDAKGQPRLCRKIYGFSKRDTEGRRWHNRRAGVMLTGGLYGDVEVSVHFAGRLPESCRHILLGVGGQGTRVPVPPEADLVRARFTGLRGEDRIGLRIPGPGGNGPPSLDEIPAVRKIEILFSSP